MNQQQLVLAFVKDLNFSVRIETVAEKLGKEVKLIEYADQIAPADPDEIAIQYGEHLEGRGAILLEKITRWHPALIIFDLGNESVPWKEWINLLTSVPATRRIPVLCYGSHVEVEIMQAAKAAGAKEVLARSRFVSQLPDLLIKYTAEGNWAELENKCLEPASYYAERGVEKFNRSEYFEAHDLFEKAWMEDESPGRELYRAILQVSVAYYQISRGNYNGAAKMFLRMRQWIDPLPDFCRGFNIAQLRDESRIAHQALLNLGPEGIDEFDLSLLKPVEYKELN